MDPNDAIRNRTPRSPSAAPRADLPALAPVATYRVDAGFRFGPDGAIYRRAESPTRSIIRVHDFGLGGVEAVASPVYDWFECEPMTQDALRASITAQTTVYPVSAEELLDKAARNDERSTRRACTKVRRLAKWKCLDTMITLTYAANQTDRALMQKHFAAFVRRVKAVIPGFEYVAVFEKQKRGAWHSHMAVARIKSGYWVRGQFVHSWKLLRSIWRSVIDGAGNIDVKASGKTGRSISKLASYLTKYICKELHLAEKYQNSYQASGCTLPPAVVLQVDTVGYAAIADAVMLLLPEWAGGKLYISPPLDSGGYFLSLTPD
jgi:hypothetical protein